MKCLVNKWYFLNSATLVHTIRNDFDDFYTISISIFRRFRAFLRLFCHNLHNHKKGENPGSKE